MLINQADSEILCYASIVKDNITFKGLSRKESVPPGWANIQWVDPRTKELSYIPAKILLFLDLKKAECLPQFQDIYHQTDLHVVIQSLTKTYTRDVTTLHHQPVCSKVSLEQGRFKYRIVDSHKYLYVYPRNFEKGRVSIKKTGIGSEHGWFSCF